MLVFLLVGMEGKSAGGCLRSSHEVGCFVNFVHPLLPLINNSFCLHVHLCLMAIAYAQSDMFCLYSFMNCDGPYHTITQIF